MNFIDKIFSSLTLDIGMDLGTSMTRVYLKGRGLVIEEPTIVAIHVKTRNVLAYGNEAKSMVGKTPANIVAIRPLKDGVVSDLEAIEKFLTLIIKKAYSFSDSNMKLPKPKIVVGVPTEITEVERRAVIDATTRSGARQTYLVETPMLAALGCSVPISDPTGSFIVDVGAGSTQMAVISLGGIVLNRSLKIAGDKMDETIINYLKEELSFLIGPRTAEELKIAVGAAREGRGEKVVVSGRDLITKLPDTRSVSSDDLAVALRNPVRIIIECIKDCLEDTPPELISDIKKDGLTLTGGGSELWGLAESIENETGIRVNSSADSTSAVIKGTGILLDDEDLLNHLSITSMKVK